MKTTNNLQPADCSSTADISAEIDLLDKSLNKLIVQFDQFHAAIAPRHDPVATQPQQPVAPMHLTVREFDEADRAPLRLLYLASRKAAFTWSAIESFQAGDFDIHTDGERILVAEGNGSLLGFASIWEPDCFLHNLFVHPSFTRKGVGRALLAGCAKHFSAPPTLKCMKANTKALQFYASQGWRALREEVGPDGPYFLMAKS